jgi:hypothetical protein
MGLRAVRGRRRLKARWTGLAALAGAAQPVAAVEPAPFSETIVVTGDREAGDAASF